MRLKDVSLMKTILVGTVLAVVAGCVYAPDGDTRDAAPFSGNRAARPGASHGLAPANAELLDESGELALFAGETAADAAYNETQRNAEPRCPRNSLFLRWRRANGAAEWRLLLSTGSDWRMADGMNEWCSLHAQTLKERFVVHKARFSSDGRHLWLVCNTYSFTFTVVCSYDMAKGTLRVLTDGDTADEQPDGTIRVKNKKTYLNDEKGNPLGAAWYDEWITPNGTVIRKTSPAKLSN